MEQLKAVEELCQPDERSRAFMVADPNSGLRPIRVEDLHAQAQQIQVAEAVPESVRDQCEVAKTMLVYSWYFYPFRVSACLQALVAVESALRLRLADDETRMKILLRTAAERGLIRQEGFTGWGERGSGSREGPTATGDSAVESYLDMLAEELPHFRNRLAHGAHMLFPGGGSIVLACVELINQLFRSDD